MYNSYKIIGQRPAIYIIIIIVFCISVGSKQLSPPIIPATCPSFHLGIKLFFSFLLCHLTSFFALNNIINILL